MSLIGLVIAFLLCMRGVYNAGVIKKGLMPPILLLSFGAGSVLLTIILLLDGELEQTPAVAVLGMGLGVALIIAGALKLAKLPR